MLDRPYSDEGCKTIGYPLLSPLSPLIPLPCVTVCHHIPFLLYIYCILLKQVYLSVLQVS